MAAARSLRLVVLMVLVLQASLSLSDDKKSDRGLGAVVVTILSQGDTFHSARAREKRERWLEQLASLTELEVNWCCMAQFIATCSTSSRATCERCDLDCCPSPALTNTATCEVCQKPFSISYEHTALLTEHYPEASWFFFTNEETQLDFEKLSDVLSHYNEDEVWFLGHALKDHKVTIIHHYMDNSGKEAIRYPNFASGWVLSTPALKRAVENAGKFEPIFNIDAQFELAMFLKYMRTPSLEELYPKLLAAADDSGGYVLTHTLELCMQQQLTPHCATAYTQDIPQCGEIGRNKIFFGVKTCGKYHSTRLPVVQGTWALDAEGSIAYYSEVEDEQFHTTDIGVPNTQSGHCGKMMAIISRFQSSPELQDRAWLVIADDDTLLSVPRLCRLLACYHSDQPILLGEAYGYYAERAVGSTTYITGGGSMVLSRAAVERIVSSGQQCSSISAPDDMFLGGIAKQLDIDIIHSPLFHQAQPSTFHPDILSLQTPISFHRHRPSDPYLIYRDYLTDTSPDPPPDSAQKKTEL